MAMGRCAPQTSLLAWPGQYRATAWRTAQSVVLGSTVTVGGIIDRAVAFTWVKDWPLSKAVHTLSPTSAIWAGVGETSRRIPPTWRLSSPMAPLTSAAVGVRRA